MDLPLWAWSEKTDHRLEIHWLSDKEKIPGEVVYKEGPSDDLLRDERTNYYSLLERVQL